MYQHHPRPVPTLLQGALGLLQEELEVAALSTDITAGLIWIAVAFVACFPAAGAAHVDPTAALRCE